MNLAKFYSEIIDYRSKFTSTHSLGVAKTARLLAGHLGWSQPESDEIELAGYLHDLGKLAIPSDILNKKGKLTNSQFNIIKSHAYHTFQALAPIKSFKRSNQWASYHHEHLDGSGYPFGLGGKDLDEGSRIMAVADKFTALTEDRPYRPGLDRKKVSSILLELAHLNKIEKNLVDIILKDYNRFNNIRAVVQEERSEEYEQLAVIS